MRMILLSSFILICQVNLDAQVEIQNDHDSLAYFIGSFPPSFYSTSEDSVVLFKQRLEEYINRINSGYYALDDSAKIFFRLGQAYSYGHNLDIEGAYFQAETYLLKSCFLSSEYLEPREALGVLYVSSNPQKYDEARQLLEHVIDRDPNGRFLGARYSLALAAKLLGLDHLARSSADEYVSLATMRGYTGYSSWHSVIWSNYNKYVSSDTTDGRISYWNRFAQYMVEYPITFEHDMDEYYNSSSAAASISLKTPKAYSVLTDSITNAIFVIARDGQYYEYEKQHDLFLSQVSGQKTRDRSSSTIYSPSISSVFRVPGHVEDYVGALTVVKGNSFHYILVFNATKSTYDQNYELFTDFEKKFRILD